MDRQGDHWVVVGREGDRSLEWEAPVVIGGDGVSSKVREEVGISYRLHRYRDAYLTTVVKRPPGFGQDGRYYMGKRTILGLFPVSKEKLYLFYLIPLAERDGFEARGIGGLRQAVLAIDGCMREPLDEVTSWTQIGLMPCLRLRADSWIADGVALLGDAVHAMNPHVAQGRNQAMEDAMALGEVLETCFAKGDFTKAALYPYEERRRPQAECLQRLGDELTLVWNSGFAPLVWLRERIFHQIQENPRLQYTTLATVAGLHSKRYSFSDRLKAIGLLKERKRQSDSGQVEKNQLE
jgi:2-polyprenyl-6-methoxyphenol hydroxylase-like FAD-dependent oxidoreductase